MYSKIFYYYCDIIVIIMKMRINFCCNAFPIFFFVRYLIRTFQKRTFKAFRLRKRTKTARDSSLRRARINPTISPVITLMPPFIVRGARQFRRNNDHHHHYHQLKASVLSPTDVDTATSTYEGDRGTVHGVEKRESRELRVLIAFPHCMGVASRARRPP